MNTRILALRLALGPCLVVCVACGAALRGPSRTLPLPQAQVEREREFQEIGRRAFEVFVRGKPEALLLDDQALRALLSPEAASQAAALRASTELAMRVEPDARAVVSAARYAGVCIQHARMQPPGPGLGLREAGFTFDRMLVVGAESGGGRLAAWVEGTFVLTDRGFYAVALHRLETPRRDHSDLDLAPCDLEFGLGSPRPVVVSSPAPY